MTDPGNAREIAEINPDFMGFIFYPGSGRFVGDKPDRSLFSIIPPGILKTGVFVNEEASVIIHTVKLYGLNLVQLHGNESAGYCNNLKKAGLNIIKAFAIKDGSEFENPETYMDVCDYFLFDTGSPGYGGSGIKFDWKKISEYHLDKPFLLSGGIGPEDAAVIKQIDHKYLFAVDINSRFEISPGIKDGKKVKEFIKKIRGYEL